VVNLLRILLDNSANNAKDAVPYAIKHSNYWGYWNIAGINTQPKAQYTTAGFLYNS